MSNTFRPSVLVIGSINMDLVLRVPRIPQAGESLLGTTYCHIPGGKGANQAVAAVRLGAAVTLAGRVGDDAEGRILKRNLVEQGIAAGCIVADRSSRTGLAVITLESGGQNTIAVFPGANMELCDEDIRIAFQAGDYDAVLLQLEVPQRIVIESCRLAHVANIPIVLDAGPAQTFPLEELCGLEIITPNETETLALTGMTVRTVADAERAAAALLARSNARAAVLKLGDKGALLREAGGLTEHFPAHRIDAVDTTAAGDAFTAALAIRYLQTGDLRNAVAWANAAGGLAAMKLGAQPSLPTAAEIEHFRAARISQESHVV